MRISKFVILFSSLGIILILFIMLPLIKISISVDYKELIKTFKDNEVINTIGLTLIASFWATLFVFIFGVPFAYILARYNFFGKEIIEGIIDVPIIIPHTAAGIALLSIFGRKFFVGKFFAIFRIKFMGTIFGIIIGMAFVSLPFLINAAKEGFKLVNPRLSKVARTLGANRLQSFLDIDFRLALKSILSGILMMWGRGISEFGAVVILAYHPMTASVLIFERFGAYGLKYARPIAFLLIMICFLIFIIIRIIFKINESSKNVKIR